MNPWLDGFLVGWFSGLASLALYMKMRSYK